MKGWFLSAGKFAAEIEQMIARMPLPGHTLEVIDCEKMAYCIDGGLPARLWKDGEPVTPPDFFYIVDTDGENGAVFHFARQLEKLGALSYNSIDAKKTAMSKISTYQVLAREGLPIVKTLVLRRDMKKELLISEIGLPMIIKPDDGFGGEGVELIKTEGELDSALARIRDSEARMLVQKYVATSKGRDVRVQTIGFEAVFALGRQATNPDEFRSNAHVGGKVSLYPLTEDMKELCHKVAKAIGLRMAGIDLMFGEDGFVVGEVNSSPGGFEYWPKNAVSVFMKDLTAQMMKLPLPHWKYRQLKSDAKTAPLSKLLMGLDDPDFVRAERTLYADCENTQKLLLAELLRANKDTEFGRAHHFDEIQTVEDYRRNVPLSDWEDYAPYAGRLEKGEEDILFPGKPTFFYRTSGTTASYKFIPESEREALSRRAIARARTTEILLMFGQKVKNRVFAIFNKSSFDTSEGGIQIGTASGRTGELTSPELAKRLTCPPQAVNEFEGEALMYMMLRTSVCYRDVTAIFGNNALMLKNLVEYGQAHAGELIADIRGGKCKYEMSDSLRALLADSLAADPARADELERLAGEGRFIPRYYWPELTAAAFWLGGSVGVYVDSVRPLLPEGTRYVDVGYGASEAKINVPMKPNTPAGALAVFCGFFEFIPEEGGEPLLAHELEDGKNYELVITTNAGLYRYRLRDLVHVDGFTGTAPNIYFLTKLADVANIAQEKIPGSMLLDAICAAAAEAGNPCRMAQVYPDPDSASYVICMEAEKMPEDMADFEKMMDEGLRRRLVRYDTYRGKLLGPCRAVLMRKGRADARIKKYAKGNASAAQVKVPVVIGELPEQEWVERTLLDF